ncbi:hypothetical protein ABIA00_004382 [Bradyrhizobium ottawaense]
MNQRMEFGLRKYEMTDPRDRISRRKSSEDLIFTNPKEQTAPHLIVLPNGAYFSEDKIPKWLSGDEMSAWYDSIPNDMTQEDLDEWLDNIQDGVSE